MVVTFDEAAEYLDTVAEEIPGEFYDELNGGIQLRREVKYHPGGKDILIMGEYYNTPDMGKYIVIYYGSFQQAHVQSGRQVILDDLRRVLIHEFTHHMEGRAGERTLELKDEQQMKRLRNSS